MHYPRRTVKDYFYWHDLWARATDCLALLWIRIGISKKWWGHQQRLLIAQVLLFCLYLNVPTLQIWSTWEEQATILFWWYGWWVRMGQGLVEAGKSMALTGLQQTHPTTHAMRWLAPKAAAHVVLGARGHQRAKQRSGSLRSLLLAMEPPPSGIFHRITASFHF